MKGQFKRQRKGRRKKSGCGGAAHLVIEACLGHGVWLRPAVASMWPGCERFSPVCLTVHQGSGEHHSYLTNMA